MTSLLLTRTREMEAENTPMMWRKIRVLLARRLRIFRSPLVSEHAKELRRIRETHDDATRTLVNLIHIGKDPGIGKGDSCKSPR